MKAIMAMLGRFLREPLVISAFIAVMLIILGTCVWWVVWGWYDQQWKSPGGFIPHGLILWDTLIIDTDGAGSAGALLRRESPNGLGPYPDIPSDYPLQNIWDDLEKRVVMSPKSFSLGTRTLGYWDRWRTLVPGKTRLSALNQELLHRVLIKLWNQGKQADSGLFDRYTGKVYPLYRDTVYVWWLELANPDGSIERDLVGMLCHPDLKDYKAAIEAGRQPSWIKVVPYDEGGISSYSFLDLPKVSF